MLGKPNRLNKHGSFAYVYRNGKRSCGRYLELVYTPAKTVRVGFSVSNKVGKAVVRNKVKRRLRAAVRTRLGKLKGCQAVVIALVGSADCDYATLDGELNTLFARAGLRK